MKHLQKFNETKEEDFFQYCLDVFAELIDDKIIDSIDLADEDDYEIIVTINKELFIDINFGTFDERLKMYKDWIEVLEDCNVAIKRLKDKFNVSIYIKDDEEFFISITFNQNS